MLCVQYQNTCSIVVANDQVSRSSVCMRLQKIAWISAKRVIIIVWSINMNRRTCNSTRPLNTIGGEPKMRDTAWRSVFLAIVTCVFIFAAGGGNCIKAQAAAAGGLGRAYESAGKSAATQKLRAGMGSTLQKAVERSRSAAAGARSRTGSSNTLKTSPAPRKTTTRNVDPAPEKAYDDTFFKPDVRINVFNDLANSLGGNVEEKAALRALFSATKSAFEAEVANKGRTNNLAAAFTFFVAATTTVYHNDPEPSDEAIDQLWDGLNAVLDESGELENMSDGEKQEIYETLIALSGLVLAGHMEGKNSGDQQTTNAYRVIAGALIETVLKTSPDKVRFDRSGLVIKP